MECMVFLFAYLWNGLEMDAPSSALNGKIHCFSRNCCCCWAMESAFFLWRWKSNWPWALHEHHPYTFCILVTLRTKGYAVIHSCTWWALSRSEFPIYIIDASELTPLEQQSWPRNSSIVFCSLLNILFECCVTFLFCFVSQAYS